MNKMTGLVLMIVGIISLLIGLVFYFSGQKSKPESELIPKQKVEIATSHPQSGSVKQGDITREDENKKKGDEFERFIVQKFNRKYFAIKDWRGDKGINGIYPKSSMNPDLEIEFRLGKEKHLFAVECKWRKVLYKGGLTVAEEDQLARYRSYERESGNPVFMAIGFGNEASTPARLFIIPLSEVNSSFLKIDYLAKYEKQEIDKNFFYDTELGELR